MDTFAIFIGAMVVILLAAISLNIGGKTGLEKAYDNCITYNGKMIVDDARVLCKKTVYGEQK